MRTYTDIDSSDKEILGKYLDELMRELNDAISDINLEIEQLQSLSDNDTKEKISYDN